MFSFTLSDMPQTVLSVNEFMMSLARFGERVSEIIETPTPGSGFSAVVEADPGGDYMFTYPVGLHTNKKHLGFYLNRTAGS